MPDCLVCRSWLVYATRSTNENARRIKALVLDIKEDRLDRSTGHALSAVVIERALIRAGADIRRAFEGNPMLVPVPRAALAKPNTIWPARRLCEELAKRGLGDAVWPIISRIQAVPKSAWQHQRPTFQSHYASLAVKPRLVSPARLLLVDDVVTSGTTPMACAARLQEAFPGIPVSAFALARVQSDGNPVAVFRPAVEYVTLSGDRCTRSPHRP